jgi:hypothetical protein
VYRAVMRDEAAGCLMPSKRALHFTVLLLFPDTPSCTLLAYQPKQLSTAGGVTTI